MKENKFEQLLVVFAIIIVLYFLVRQFWPLLLIFMAYLLYRGIVFYQKFKQLNHISFFHQNQEENIKTSQEMFQEQVDRLKRKESEEIIDAEFVVKDREREEQRSQTR